MIVHVKVKPSFGKQEIVKNSEKDFTVFLKSAPENGKANRELVKLLHKYFKTGVKIKSGLTGRNKIVEVVE